jgi:hypothetical protein
VVAAGGGECVKRFKKLVAQVSQVEGTPFYDVIPNPGRSRGKLREEFLWV